MCVDESAIYGVAMEVREARSLPRWGASVLAVGIATFVVACGGVAASSSPGAPATKSLAAQGTPSPAAAASASPNASPEFDPGSGFTSGRVIRLIPNGVVIGSEGREIEVSLDRVVDVWKETSVPASAIEVGDGLSISGTAGSPFVARYVWANIGQIDGVIRAIDATGMDLETRPNGHVQRIDFSQHVEFGTVYGLRKVTRADLVVGRQVGLVVYRPSAGPLRATRVWAEADLP